MDFWANSWKCCKLNFLVALIIMDFLMTLTIF